MRALTNKQETYVLGLVAGMNQTESHRHAYPNKMSDKVRNETASKLSKNPKVVSRLTELRKPAIEAAQMTLEGHLDDLKRLRNKANNAGDLGAAIRAEIARGKHSGVAIDRKEIVGLGGSQIVPVINVYQSKK
tara:strand:+ start:4278 stop:4676 length:399 start_codon:yes stop_codon:yes gene_type:complete